jgi:hypothetical protein
MDIGAITAEINSMGLGAQIGLLLELIIIKFGVWVIMGLVQIICIGRFLEIYIHVAIAPIPLATLPSDDLNSIAKNFLKSFAAVSLQGALIYLILSFFPQLVNSNILGEQIAFTMLLYSIVLVIAIFSAGKWAKSICNAM